MNNDYGGHGKLTDFKYIVLHSTESAKSANPEEEAEGVMTYWENSAGDPERDGVGAHFVVARNGTVYQWVSEDLICWHAGDYQEGSNVDYSDVPDRRKKRQPEKYRRY